MLNREECEAKRMRKNAKCGAELEEVSVPNLSTLCLENIVFNLDLWNVDRTTFMTGWDEVPDVDSDEDLTVDSPGDSGPFAQLRKSALIKVVQHFQTKGAAI